MAEQQAKVQILLSTYNGERYLKEQLDSLAQLNGFSRIKVLVRDDGSQDGTAAILKEYEASYGFEILWGENTGVNQSIQILLEQSDFTCDYFAICDQDDVWLPQKIELACMLLDQEAPELPLLFGSLSKIVDQDLNPMGSSVVPKRGVSYYNAMVQNVIAGHTQVFNRTLRGHLIARDIGKVHVIDWWIYLVAAGLGKVVFAPEFTVLHRQHGKNAVGYTTNPFQVLRRRLAFIKNGRGNAISLQLEAFYQQYGKELCEAYRLETQRYLYSQNSLWKRLQYVAACRAYRQQPAENFVFKLLYCMGKYQI